MPKKSKKSKLEKELCVIDREIKALDTEKAEKNTMYYCPRCYSIDTRMVQTPTKVYFRELKSSSCRNCGYEGYFPEASMQHIKKMALNAKKLKAGKFSHKKHAEKAKKNAKKAKTKNKTKKPAAKSKHNKKK